MKKNLGKIITSSVLVGLMLAVSVMPVMASKNKPAASTGKGKDVKNVIIMISDGWGYNQILATDYFSSGKAGTQIYEKFPTKLAMSTYSLGTDSKDDDLLGYYDPATIWNSFEMMKYHYTDCPAAGTAMSTGSKTYDAAIGVDQDKADLRHMTEDFEALGKATGVVSSVSFSHATPASFVAHNVSNNNYSELANEMLMDSATDVIMGCGHPWFDNNGMMKTSPNYKYVGGQATWDALVAGTLGNDADNDGDLDPWTLIQTKAEFEAIQTGPTPARVIGIPQVYETLQQARDGDKLADAYEVPFSNNVPDLTVMSKGALNILDNDKDGFFLMIEGGAVDWAGHAGQSGRLIEEQADFNTAVNAVCEWVENNSSWAETLVIVTGDHETGYLTGTAGVYDEVVNNGIDIMPTMAWNSTNHTNQLVPFFAKGAGAEIYKKLADAVDPVRGKYLDNTEISAAIRDLIE
jgi:alkaline phosphatase